MADRAGNIYKAKIFVDATGVSGFFSRKFEMWDKNFSIATGLEYNVEYKGGQNQSHLFIGKLYQGGYAWIFPFGGNRAIFGFGSFNNTIRTQLKERIDALFEIKIIKQLVKKDNDEVNGGTIPITDVKTKFIYKNIICIGDSVSPVNPFVGEGNKFIIEAGAIAVPYILDAVRYKNLNNLKGYEHDWNKKFYSKYVAAKKVQISADNASRNDLLSDLAALFLATKRDQTFTKLLSGDITKKALYLP